MSIPYGRQFLSKKDISQVVKVLKSDWLTQGPAIGAFEKALADFCGAHYAVAVSNGTAALHLANLALGVGNGDEVVTTSNSFVATSNSVLYCGGTPIFSDIESKHQNIDPAKVEAKITKKTMGIIPVHFAGHACDMEAISRLAKKRGLFVLEDACHALGGEYKIGNKWHKVGSCSHSDAAVLSFHPVKSITTGEGGAILTNRADLYENLLRLRSHGVTKNPQAFENKDLAFFKSEVSPWYYEMQELGFNYRITDIQCALGISQLNQLPSFIKKRQRIAKLYQQAFKNLSGITLPEEASDCRSAWHLFVIQFNLKSSRAKIFSALRKAGLGVQVHYIPIHYQPYYQKLGHQRGSLPICERYYAQAISLPIFPSMNDSQIREVIRVVQQTVRRHNR